MGLIRKALSVPTAGLVSPNSKKQRVAKRQLKATEKLAGDTQQDRIASLKAQTADIRARGAAHKALKVELAAGAARAKATRDRSAS